jgi:transcriptional regulator with XRE-family HTH domain
MSDLKKAIGTKVKTLRKRHGLSIKALAEAIQSSEPTLIRIEKGRSSTDVDTLERLAKQLDVRPADLLAGTPLDLTSSKTPLPPPGMNTGLGHSVLSPTPPRGTPTSKDALIELVRSLEESDCVYWRTQIESALKAGIKDRQAKRRKPGETG